MPKYSFDLTDGKKLVLEGDTQPSDADVEELAKAQGVTLALAETKEPWQAKVPPLRGEQPAGSFNTDEGEPGNVSRLGHMLESAARPESVGDMLGLVIPATQGLGAVRMGIPKLADMAEKLGPKIAEGARTLQKHSPVGFAVDLLTRHNPVEAIGVGALPYGIEWAGNTLAKIGGAVKNFKPWEINLNGAAADRKLLTPGAVRTPPPADASFVRGVPGQYAEGVLQGEPVGIRPMSSHGPIVDGELVGRPALPKGSTPMGSGGAQGPRPDPSFVRGVPAEPAMSLRPTLPPRKAAIPMGPATEDASFVKAVPGEFAQSERATGIPTLKQEVQRLSQEGLGAEDIADRLKAHPDFASVGTKKERVNLVREARGGQAGQIPAGAKKAIDAAIGNLTTAEAKRAYLMKAPNGAVYDYVKAKLGI